MKTLQVLSSPKKETQMQCAAGKSTETLKKGSCADFLYGPDCESRPGLELLAADGCVA